MSIYVAANFELSIKNLKRNWSESVTQDWNVSCIKPVSFEWTGKIWTRKTCFICVTLKIRNKHSLTTLEYASWQRMRAQKNYLKGKNYLACDYIEIWKNKFTYKAIVKAYVYHFWTLNRQFCKNLIFETSYVIFSWFFFLSLREKKMRACFIKLNSDCQKSEANSESKPCKIQTISMRAFQMFIP